MEKTYYYRVGEQQIGPVSLDQMRGNVSPNTYVWADGMANWQTISQLPDLMMQLGLSAAQPSYQQPSYQQYNAGNTSSPNGAMPTQPNNHLVLAIITIFICQLFGIIALVMALQSDSCYKNGDYQGAVKKANTAKTLSLVGIIGTAVCVILYIFVFIAAAGAGALQTY